MKKYFYSLITVTAMLFAVTSCSQDEFPDGVGGETMSVNFSVKANSTTQTRTLSDGSVVGAANHATKLIYAVYENGKETATALIQNTVSDDNADGTFNVTIPLVKGLKYDVLFLAYNEANNVFGITNDNATTTNLKALTLNNNALKANQEAYDVFFAAEKSYAVTGIGKTIYLTRPFAQLNVGTILQDLKDASDLDVWVKQSEVVVKGTPTTFNVLTGEVSNEADVTFAAADIFQVVEDEKTDGFANEKFTVTRNGSEETYYYLGMNYVLADEEKSLHDVEVSFYRSEGKFNTIEVSNLPLQRNYRTNIVGNLLTTKDAFDVVVVPTFDGNYGPTEMLQEAINQGGEVTLPYNIKLTKSLVVPEGVTVKLNLKGYELSNPSGYAITNNGNLTIDGEGRITGLGCISTIGGELTVNGGNYYASSDYADGYYQQTLYAKGSKVTINGGNFDATVGGQTNAMIMVQTGTEMTINGGTFVNVSGTLSNFDPYLFTYGDGGKLTINAGEFYGGWRFNMDADTDIYGGTFTLTTDGQSFNSGNLHTLTLYGGIFGFGKDATQTAVLNCVADGYETVSDDENARYYIVPEGTTDVTIISTAEELFAFAAAVNAGNSFDNQVVMLGADIDLQNQKWTPVGACNTVAYFQGTFDGCNHTISGLNVDNSTDTYQYSTSGLFGWIDAAAATIKNVKVDGATVKGSHWVGVIAGYMTGSIENCTVTNSTVEGIHVTDDADGDKVGGIVGHLNSQSSLIGNVVSNTTIKGNRDVGGIAGSIVTGNTMRNCQVTDVTIIYTTAKSYASAGEIVSGRTGYVPDNTNTAANVKIYQTVTDDIVKDVNGTYVAFEGAELKSLLQTIAANETDVNIELQGDVTIAGEAYANRNTYPQTNLTINGNGNALTFTDNYRTYFSCADGGKIVLKDMNLIRSTTNTSTHWHNDNLWLNSDIEMEKVNITRGINISEGVIASLKNCTITETVNDSYAMFILPGADVTIDGCVIDADDNTQRGIKITSNTNGDGHETAITVGTTLSVSNTVFKTAKKSAILVDSHTNTTITWADGNDISKVQKDTKNPVWNDAAAVAYYDKVKVNNGAIVVYQEVD